MHSSESSSGGSGMVKWSERYNPEKPLASTIATQHLQSGHVNPVWPSTEIDTSIITVPPRRAVIVDCSEVSKYILPNPRCDHSQKSLRTSENSVTRELELRRMPKRLSSP